MNTTGTFHQSITSREFEGYYYVVTNDGVFGKGCSRCGGTGHYSFNGFDSICYKCNNIFELRLGDVFDTEEQAQKWCADRKKAQAKRDAKREALRLAKLAKRTAAWDALEAAHPQVWALLTSVVNVRAFDQADGDVYPSKNERDSFLLQLADQLWKLDEKPFSARQIEVLQQKAEKRAGQQAEAAAHPAPAGRVAVTGEIVSTKVVEGDYGTSYKILVKDDQGFKVWCSLPKAQADEAYDDFLTFLDKAGSSTHAWGSAVFFLGDNNGYYAGIKGRRITFTATLQPSQDDVSFAFGSRPTKGAWL